MKSFEQELYEKYRVITFNPFDSHEMLVNTTLDQMGPFIPLDELLIIKEKVDNAIAFAENEDVQKWNDDFLKEQGIIK